MSDIGNPIIEQPSTIERITPVPCDYVDVTRQEENQPRFLLQPHRSGGTPVGPALVLEIEGARALWRHLGKLIEEPGDAD